MAGRSSTPKRSTATATSETAWSVSSLKPNPHNPRTIHTEAFKRLVESIQRDPEFMRLRPIVVDGRKNILGGNMRYRACLEIGMTELPPDWVVKATGLTKEQRRRFIIVDNAPEGMAGEWDWDILANEWDESELEALGFDLSDIEFGEEGTEGQTDPDDVPELDDSEPPASEPGALYILGNHRLLCGDATSADDVARLLGDCNPLLMVTDPPYGVNYDADWRNHASRTCDAMGNCAIGAGATGKVENDDRADWRDAWALFPGDVAYVWHASTKSPVVAESLVACDFELRNLIVWGKNVLVIGRGHYHHQHEPCWYGVRKSSTASWVGDHKQTTLWQIDKQQKNETGHSTQKPVECMARPIRNHDAPEVYDPFLGSGTTIIACEQLGRSCFGMEVSPKYCDIIRRRWAEFVHGEDCDWQALTPQDLQQ